MNRVNPLNTIMDKKANCEFSRRIGKGYPALKKLIKMV